MKALSDPVVIAMSALLVYLAFLAVNHGGVAEWAFTGLVAVVLIFYAWGASPGIPRIA